MREPVYVELKRKLNQPTKDLDQCSKCIWTKFKEEFKHLVDIGAPPPVQKTLKGDYQSS